MTKTELNELVERLDRWLAAAEVTHDPDERVYPEIITARLLAEQTLMLAEQIRLLNALLATVQALPSEFETTRADIVGAIVQRTWPGVIAFDEADNPGKPPAEEEEDE